MMSEEEIERLTLQYRANTRAEILNVKTAILAKENRADEIPNLVKETLTRDL